MKARRTRSLQRIVVVAAVLLAPQSCSSNDNEQEPATSAADDAGARRHELAEPSSRDAAPTPAQTPIADAAIGACSGPAGRTLRTLIVGNSQIYFWDLPKLLSGLSQSGPPSCPRIAAEGFTSGGQNLRRLWLNGDAQGRNLATTITNGKYDVVVISESIDLVELPPPYEQFVTFANTIIDAARASGATPILYATPYVDQENHWGFREMALPQLALGAARSVTVAAGGLAWLRVWEVLPSLDLHHADHEHPGFDGSIISAMVIYSAITRATPIGLTPPPPACYLGDCAPAITPAESDVFQRAAWAEAQATALQ